MPKKTIALGALILALSMFMSCQIPDYQLGFELNPTSSFTNVNSVTVEYRLSNIGLKKIDNATIRLEAESAPINDKYIWTPKMDLDVGETSVWQTATIFFSSIVTVDYVHVTGSAWDTEDDSGWF